MKTLFVCLLIGSLFSTDIRNYELSDFKDPATPIVWLGIDYSQSKMVGSEGFKNPYEIVRIYFDKWNSFIYQEPAKYDVHRSLHRVGIKYDLDATRKKNQLVNPEELVINHSYTLDQSSIEQNIKSYELSNQKEGIGISLVVESYDKMTRMATYHLVLFDINSRKILFQEKITSAPHGLGLRNYWAHTFYKTLLHIELASSRNWK